MIIILLLLIVGITTVFHFFAGGGNPISAIYGAFKGSIHAIAALSALTILSLILKIGFVIKVIGWLLAILALDILTPPYGIDIESIFALPLANWLHGITELTLGWAIGIAYAFVFLIAAAYLALWWFVLRKHV